MLIIGYLTILNLLQGHLLLNLMFGWLCIVK